MSQQQSVDRSTGQHKLQTARDETSQVAQHTTQAGRQVAQTAAGQGRETVDEARRQAHNLMERTSAQLMEQADVQQKRAAARLRTLGDELASMSSRDEQHGMAGDLAQQAADQAHRAADWLDQRQPGALLAEVREFARRSPGVFLAGAVVAGLVAGRLTRNLASDGAGPTGGAHMANPPGSEPKREAQQ
ncbi:hypothetical protein [Micromonospora sonneratiae]|uniref:DUF3618 domain-containing protein n=1 Tax=Micromonospora sonneratiae TaxID=1184706 RepID=A0ABW3YLV4_9ACTN